MIYDPFVNRYLGRPCPRRHDGWRYKRNNECCECVRLRVKRQRGEGKRPTIDGSSIYMRGEQAHGTEAVQGGSERPLHLR